MKLRQSNTYEKGCMGMKIETLKLWEDRDDVELTTFLTMPNPDFPGNAPKPAVIVCPGGAYQSCPRHGNEGDPAAMAFAMDGYQAFVLEYSVETRAPKGKAQFPAQMLDYGKAILAIREHAVEWDVDVDRISIIGFSAGGHMCATIAARWNDGLLAEKFGVPAQYFRPLTAMLIYPITDFVLQSECWKGQKILSEMNETVFGLSEPDREKLEDASPVRYVTEDCPPVFLAAAQDDGLVTVENTLVMAQALQKAGVPYEVHIFRYGDHGFGMGRNLTEAYRTDKSHACAGWLPMAKTFLMHQAAPETTEYEANVFALFENFPK